MKKIEFHKLSAEQQARAPILVEKWCKIALSTGRMTTDEKIDVHRCIAAIYEAAKIKAPKETIIVRSPLEMANLYGRMAWEHHVIEQKLKPSKAETAAGIKECTQRWSSCYHGGNMWPSLSAWVEFATECGADVKRGAWDEWDLLAQISGFRCLHEDFCIVSEKPLVLKTEFINNRYIPHCEDGPSHLWADDFKIYHWHGTRVEPWVIEEKDKITVEKIKAESNVEIRRVMREIFGDGRYLVETGAKVIDADFESAKTGAAFRALMEDNSDPTSAGDRFLVGTDGSTRRTYYMPVGREPKTCKQAHESICGFPEELIIHKS